MVAEEAGQLRVGYSQLILERECEREGRTARGAAPYLCVARVAAPGRRTALMKEVFRAAGRAGCDCLWLGVWEHNPKAIAFYRKFNFEIVGQQAFMLGNESQRDIVMSARIG